MAIELSTLVEAARRTTATRSTVTIEEARTAGRKTVFLCHSHDDRTYVRGFIQLLREAGWDAYVDWMDESMPPRPNRTTASNIKRRIREADYFLFLATPNSVASRWCPWEIGIADGVKAAGAIMVVQTKSGGTHYGNEYLELYRHVDFSDKQRLPSWRPGEEKGRRLAGF
jgi:hypothetical protein